ncbi:LysR family transcriptional regulator [Pararhodobacter zhoushanensis]|uniref:LysR family transcriptional regulator n=1 Tax=Pararhodobacter zhoushanensis TaxID=2479545 RepID=UPI000F8D635F|nr:LysR family transcriptional regulator [Pararhodobacter zhoushanensis]
MDTLDNIRTFLAVARHGSFSATARALDTVPSVVSKRVSQLEHQLKTPLFVRSTRELALTEAGRVYSLRFQAALPELDAVLHDGWGPRSALQAHLRIKCPTTLSMYYIGDALVSFRSAHPGVRIELVLMDRSVNPIEERFDIAIGALPTTYTNVVDIPLCGMKRLLVASPDYLRTHGMPDHPRDLAGRECNVFAATGATWVFEGPSGTVSVEVQNSFTANDSTMLLKAVEHGLGFATLASYIAQPAVDAGRIVAVLPDFRLPDFTIKAMVPDNRRLNPAVQVLLQHLIDASQDAVQRANTLSSVPHAWVG